MKRTLKSLFRTRSHSTSSAPNSTPHQEPRPGPAQLLDQRRVQGLEAGSNSQDDQNSKTSRRSSRPSSKPVILTPSVSRPISTNGDVPVGTTDYAPPPRNLPEGMEGSTADDYRAYLPATSTPNGSSTRSNLASSDAEFMSLSGDSRLRTGASEMRHNEDIADRNIEHYGSGSKSSRHSSMTSQQQAAQERNVRRKSVAASIESLGSPDSLGSSSGSISRNYALGTGVPTEGGLIDGIFPHAKNPDAPPYNRKHWPSRVARDELHPERSRQKCHANHDDDPNGTDTEGDRRQNGKKSDGIMDLREAVMRGPQDYDNGLRANLDGVVDLNNSEDTDKQTRWAPEVIHETVKPHEHEIIEERIYREIHNHEVYHYVQPVYQTEILPARHWIYNAKGELVEVPVDQLPDCTGAAQRWSIVRGDREKSDSYAVRSPPQVRKPRILSDKTYMTPEGYERRETTILHPPELEDLSGYDGPVVPIEFLHHPMEAAPERSSKKLESETERTSNGRQFTMKEVAAALPVARVPTNGSSSSASRPGSGSSGSAPSPPSTKRLSIHRKPIPTAVS